ncbi:MAG TPA: efflux RND transporter periplasmic adaptor subunit [Tepidisphaeraceae bacterium]|jgi:RND family efflux transporter MFP subunit|nr:efflux RND transporter periplasmic adaptor subunit [Tepidisphaeraceae bacterium]
MRTWMVVLLVLIAAAAGAGGGFWFAHRGATPKPEAGADTSKTEETPVAKVTVAPIRRGTISQNITAYGTISAPANEVRALSVSFESRVAKIWVTPGQAVTEGQPLIDVAASAATTLLVEEAKTNFASAERDYNAVKTRYDQNLATNAELNTAQSALQLAKGRLQSLNQGMAGAGTLKSPAAGIVSRIDTQVGQIVPIGGPLLEVASHDKIECRLGIDGRDVAALKMGEEVTLRRVDARDDKPIIGHVAMIGKSVDPATHFVEVIVSLPPDASLFLNGFVTATLSVKDLPDAMIVPRSAVLPGDDGDFEVFTIDDGKAVPHSVKVGIETDDESQIVSDELKAGDNVVIVGNNELEKGMSVTVETPEAQTHSVEAPMPPPAPATPPATVPAPPAAAPPPPATNPAGINPAASTSASPFPTLSAHPETRSLP